MCKGSQKAARNKQWDGRRHPEKTNSLSWVLILRIIILEFWLIHLFCQIWPPAFYFSHWPFWDTWDNTRSILVIVTSLGLTGSTVIWFFDYFSLFLPSSVLCEGAQSVCFSSLFFLLLPRQWTIFVNTDSVIISVLMTHRSAPDLLSPI